jgi:hypothetical protein
MCRTLLRFALAGSLFLSYAPLAAPVCAQSQSADKTQAQTQQSAPLDKQAVKIKRTVGKISVGERITVFLKNGDDLHGTVSYIGADNFDVAEVDMHRLINVQYQDVQKVRNGYSEINLLTGKRYSRPRGLKIAAFVGVLALIFVPLVIYATGPPD